MLQIGLSVGVGEAFVESAGKILVPAPEQERFAYLTLGKV